MNKKGLIIVLSATAVALSAVSANAKGGGSMASCPPGGAHANCQSQAYINWYMSNNGGHVPVDPPITNHTVNSGGTANTGSNSGGPNTHANDNAFNFPFGQSD